MLRIVDFTDGVNHWRDAKQLRVHCDCKQMVVWMVLALFGRAVLGWSSPF